MPRVPTILADQKLDAPGFSSQADPSAFGYNEGLANLPRGINQAAAGLSALDHEIERNREKRANEVDERWIGDSLYQERNHLNEWQSNPENNSSEDYAKNFKAYAESRVKTYEKAAPSKRALRDFQSHMQGFVEGRYGSALMTSERTRVENTKDSVINQTSQALGMFRDSNGSPNVDPTLEVLTAHDDIRSRIQKLYGDTDPTLRRKLGAYVDSEFALGIAPQDPGQARIIVNGSKDLEESAKIIINNKIDSMEQDMNAAGRDDFNRFRADYMVRARDGKVRDPIPLDQYQGYYDKDIAKRLKTEDDQKLRVLDKANVKFSELSITNPDHQNRVLADMRGKIVGAEDDATFELLRSRIASVQQLQASDPVSWLQGYNPEVQEANKKAQAATGANVEEALINRSRSILKYQGPVPEGDPNPEKYLGLPLLDRRLMTSKEVEENLRHINLGAPSEVNKRIREVIATYPGQDNEDIAFNDLARDPKGLKQDYRLVWQNKNQWWVQTFIGALGDAKGFSALADERKGALAKEVEENPKWRNFEQAMVGPDPTRADEIAGFKQGIMTYANYFASSQGLEMKAAVDKSIKHLLDSTTGQTTMNGRPMMIFREREGDKPNRTDEEISDIGRRLEVSLKDLDPREIDQSRFGSLYAISKDEKNVDRMQALRDQITRKSFFVPSMDGQAMILYTAGDDGIAFEVRDRQKRAFIIQLDDLPKFTERAYIGGSRPGAAGATVDRNIFPQDTYPLREGFNESSGIMDRTMWHWLGVYQKQTHWPTNAAYWKKAGRNKELAPPPVILDMPPFPKKPK